MSSSLAVIRRACLVLGLLMAVGGSAWAQCTCTTGTPPPPPTSCAPVDFGSVALGSSSTLSVPFTSFPPTAGPTGFVSTATIVGPNAGDFAIVGSSGCNPIMPSGFACSYDIKFTPLACGPRIAFLVVSTFQLGGSCSLIIPLTGTGTFTPVVGPTLNFPSTCAGTNGASITLTLPANTVPSIVGPGNFSITATNCPQGASTCTVTIRFNPLAAACGTVTSTLQLTSTLTNCVVATFELSGFACSFTCAIGLAGTASLTMAGRKCVLDSVQIAANAPAGAAGQTTRCAALRCAECCALSDLALRPAGSAARASIQALLDQIRCLEACFGCAPFPC